MTFDASYDMDKVARRRMENVEGSAAGRRFVDGVQAQRAAINRAFALAYNGDEIATAKKVAEELGVSLHAVQHSDAYADAMGDEDQQAMIELYA
jgi:hypothetical protein